MSEQEPRTEQARTSGTGQCVCGGAGPMLTDFLERLGPSSRVREHFDQARIEFLKGLRTMIDERIEKLSQKPDRGTKVTVE